MHNTERVEVALLLFDDSYLSSDWQLAKVSEIRFFLPFSFNERF